MITIQEIKTAILSGKFTEEEIADIQTAIRNRKEIEQAEFKSTLHEGQTVWFNQHTRPYYLQGQELTIIRVNRARVLVRLKNPTAGGRFGGEIRSTVSLITTTKPPYAKPTQRERMTITSQDVGKMPKGII